MPIQTRKKPLSSKSQESVDIFTDILKKIDQEELEFQSLKQYILDIQQKYQEEWKEHKTNDEKELEKINTQLKKTKDKLKLEKDKSVQLIKEHQMEKEQMKMELEKVYGSLQDISENYLELKNKEKQTKEELNHLRSVLDEKVKTIQDLQMDVSILEQDVIDFQKKNENLEKEVLGLVQLKEVNKLLNEELEKMKNDRNSKLKLIEVIRLDLNQMEKQKCEIIDNYSKQINDVLIQKRDLELLVKDLRMRIQKTDKKSKCNLL